MKVLVTGAAGFIGRYLVPALTAKGYTVVATDMLLPTEPAEKSVTWRKLDVSLKESAVDAASATAVMLAHDSVIKRPVVQWSDGRLTVGFKAEEWERALPSGGRS